MRFYRCKCGNRRAFGSMSPAPCSSCGKCGSDLAESPSEHSEPVPHEYVTKYDQDTGAPYERCKLCLRKRSEIEQPEES